MDSDVIYEIFEGGIAMENSTKTRKDERQASNVAEKSEEPMTSPPASTSTESLAQYRYSEKERIMRWLKYGVFLSFFPLVLGITFDKIAGYNLVQLFSRHALDFLLVVFAVAVNAYSSVQDLENGLKPKDRGKYTEHAVFNGILVLCVYSYLYQKFDAAEVPDKWDSPNTGIIMACHIFSWILFIFIGWVGVKIEKSKREC